MPSSSEAHAPSRFAFSERAEPFRLRPADPYVHGYAWRHPAPEATLVLVHGLQSHAQWFAEAADLLVERGLAVYALDRHGSGSSPGRHRGDIARFRDWFDEVDEVVRLATEEHPEAPVHLVGHCFGANIVLGYALTRPSDARSIAMLTPGLYILPDYSLAEKVRVLAASVLRPEARFGVPQDDELFTRDPAVLDWIRGDSLGSKELTARCLVQISAMVRWLRRHASELAIPVLVFEAKRDRIADNAGNRRFLGRALGNHARWSSYDVEHFLLAEPCRDEVLDELTHWVSNGELQ